MTGNSHRLLKENVRTATVLAGLIAASCTPPYSTATAGASEQSDRYL